MCSSSSTVSFDSPKFGPLPVRPFSVAAGKVAISSPGVVESRIFSADVVEATGRPNNSWRSIIFREMKSRSSSITNGILFVVSVVSSVTPPVVMVSKL